MTSEDIPQPVSEADRESFSSILSVPWLRASILPTGGKWGRRIADVEVSRFPTPLTGQVMLIEDVEGVIRDAVRLVVYRCDRYDHRGWDEEFSITLTFPDLSQYEVEVAPSFRLADGHSMVVPLSPSTVVRERQQQINRKIPRIVFNLSAPVTKQISQDVRRLLKNVRRITKTVQCTALYLVLEDDACKLEVASSDIPHFLEAYNSIVPPSYKADLMRYYLLYKYGGVYLDDKTLLRQSLDSDIFDSILRGDGDSCDFFICNHLTPEIAFMGSRRGSPIMLKALTTAISKILNREYSNHRLGITGNIMFTKLLGEGLDTSPPEIPAPQVETPAISRDIAAKWVRYWGEMCALLPVILSNDGILVRNSFFWQRQAIPTADWPKPASHYTSLWTRKMVYTDGNPPPSAIRLAIASRISATALHISIGVGIIILIAFIISRYPPITWI